MLFFLYSVIASSGGLLQIQKRVMGSFIQIQL
jgi:hypothetical protein